MDLICWVTLLTALTVADVIASITPGQALRPLWPEAGTNGFVLLLATFDLVLYILALQRLALTIFRTTLRQAWSWLNWGTLLVGFGASLVAPLIGLAYLVVSLSLLLLLRYTIVRKATIRCYRSEADLKMGKLKEMVSEEGRARLAQR